MRDIILSDVECASWWHEFGHCVGRGNTPDTAYENLIAMANPLTAQWDYLSNNWVLK